MNDKMKKFVEKISFNKKESGASHGIKANAKKIIPGTIAGILAVSLIVTTVCVHSAKAEELKEKAAREDALVQSVESAAGETGSSATGTEDAAGKSERVYIVTDGDGNTQEVIVNDHLKNKDNSAVLKDETDLKDIENTNGDETFTQNGDTLSWDAEGNDIYYSGSTDKPLPVNVKISYELDGQKMTADEIAGKSGKVKIRFDYTNNAKETIKINNEDMEVFVPFTMVTGMILDPDKFTNVEVENGKCISEGGYQAVIGYAMPGLSESLGIGIDYLEDYAEEVDIPEYVEVTADVTDFELEMTMTMAFNDLLDKVDTNKFDLSDLDDSMDDLEDASSQLLDGTAKLQDGSKTLADSMAKAKSGSEELALGVSAIVDGIQTTLPNSLQSTINDYSGAASMVESASSTLSGAVNTLVSDAVTAGATNAAMQTAEIIKAASAQPITDLTTDVGTIGAIMQGLSAQTIDVATSTGTQTYYTSPDETGEAVNVDTYSVSQQTVFALTAEQYQTIMAALADANTKSVDIDANTVMAAIDQSAIQSAAATAAADDMESVTSAAGTLANAAGARGAVTALSGVKSNVAQKFDDESLNKLKNGASELADGTVQLTDGAQQLADGAAELNDGMNKFDDEGIKKLVDLYKGDVKGLKNRVEAIKQAGAEYQSFTKVASDTDGTVRFIFKSGAVEK